MSEKRNLISELGRARQRLLFFAELLAPETKLDAVICINEFCDTAEREIEKAYWDGYKQYRMQVEAKRPVALPSEQLGGGE